MNNTGSIQYNFIYGSLSGGFSTILLQPFDVLKTQMQVPATQGTPSTTITKSIQTVYSKNGVKGFWSGCVPSLWRSVPGVGLYFSFLGLFQSVIVDSRAFPTPVQSGLIGACSRLSADVILMPFTVVKTQYESGLYCHKSVLDALQNIYSQGGVVGLYRGMTATIIRDVPYSCLYMMFYTAFKRMAFQGPQTADNPFRIFCCASLGALFASIATQPADVIKTHRQLHSRTVNLSLFDILRRIAQTDGYLGYFKGLLPRCARRTIMSAISWTSFESLFSQLKKN